MNRYGKYLLFSAALWAAGTEFAVATPQRTGDILYQGKMYDLEGHPVAEYFRRRPDWNLQELYSNERRDSVLMTSTANWKGYSDYYEIGEDGYLYLTELTVILLLDYDPEKRESASWTTFSLMPRFFPGQERVRMEEVTETLRLGYGPWLYKHYGEWGGVRGHYLMVRIEQGRVLSVGHRYRKIFGPKDTGAGFSIYYAPGYEPRWDSLHPVRLEVRTKELDFKSITPYKR